MTNHKPKVLLFSHICYPTHITGAEKMLLLLARELQPHFQCVLVVPNEGVLSEEARLQGVTSVVQKYPILYELYKPEPNVEELLHNKLSDPEYGSLINMLHMHRPDLIITNTSVNVLPAVAGKMLGIPVAWIIAEVIQESPWTSLCVNIIDRYSDWLVGISYATLQPFSSPGMALKKFVFSPSWRMEDLAPETWPTQRLAKRAQMGINESHKVIGYISADIYANKGLDHFAQMAVTLCAEFADTHFMIIGKPVDEGYFQSCMDIFRHNGFASRVSNLSFESNISSLYPAMDIVVVPSLLNEGFGLTALEGLIYGKPVVAYRSGGLIEIITATGNAHFLADQGNVVDLTMKARQLLQDPDLRIQVGQRSSQAVQDVFGISAYRERLNQILSRIAPIIGAKDGASIQTQLKYPNQSVVKGHSSTLVWLLENGVKRHILSEDVFRFYKWNWNEVLHVPDADLQAYPTGRTISRERPLKLNSPVYFVAKGSESTVYLLHHSVRRPFTSEAAFRRNHNFDRIVTLLDSELEEFTPGVPIDESEGGPVSATRKPSRKRAKRISKQKKRLVLKPSRKVNLKSKLKAKRTSKRTAKRTVKRAVRGKAKNTAKRKTRIQKIQKRSGKKVTNRLKRPARVRKKALRKKKAM